MEDQEVQFGTSASDTEPGMNLISVDFDLVMVNRTNERLYGKPMVALLGNKCYREFEKRDEPCPHCPGRLALETGVAQEAESTGLRDDGTRFAARIKAHPVIGPDNRPTGFIEIVEDITEQKRAESLALLDTNLQAALAGIQNVRSALREALQAALLVEGIDYGAAFLVGDRDRRPELVLERGLAPGLATAFAELSGGSVSSAGQGGDLSAAGSPRVVAVVPILHRSATIASLVVGSTVYPEMPPSLRNGLQVLGATTGTAISRILAEQSRGDAIADLEAVIAASPLATWAIDGRGRITMWNKAAERVFGWRAAEVAGSAPPWGPAPGGAVAGRREAVLDRKDGRPVEVRLSTAPFRDVVGNDSALIFIAEDLRAQRRILELESRVVELEGRLTAQSAAARSTDAPPPTIPGVRVLVVDGNEPWGEELTGILSSLGCTPVRCVAPEQTALVLAQAGSAEQPFDVAVVALLGPGGGSGLSQRAALRSLGLQAPVLMSSDVDVHGHEQHGIAAVVKRPYSEEAVREALMAALRDQRRVAELLDRRGRLDLGLGRAGHDVHVVGILARALDPLATGYRLGGEVEKARVRLRVHRPVDWAADGRDLGLLGGVDDLVLVQRVLAPGHDVGEDLELAEEADRLGPLRLLVAFPLVAHVLSRKTGERALVRELADGTSIRPSCRHRGSRERSPRRGRAAPWPWWRPWA